MTLVRLLSLSLATGLLAVTATQSYAAASIRPSSTYVALGDSITFGYGLSPAQPQKQPSSLAYPYLVGAVLKDRTIDLGVPGLTAPELLSTVQSGKLNATLGKASLITVDIGSNDLLRLVLPYIIKQQAPPKPLIAQLDYRVHQYAAVETNLLKAIRQRSHARIVLVNFYDPMPSGTVLYPLGQTLIAGLNQQLTRVAAVFGLPVADVYDQFHGATLIDVRVLEADIHPTVYGQAAIAGAVEEALSAPRAYTPVAYAVARTRATLFESVSLRGKAVALPGGSVVRVLPHAPGATTWPVQEASAPFARGYTPATAFVDRFTRYLQAATFARNAITARTEGVTVDGRAVGNLASAIVVGKLTYVPLAPVAQAFGYRVQWDAPTRTAFLTRTLSKQSGVYPEKPATQESGTRSGTSGSRTSTTATGPLIREGIGLFFDGARVATPSQSLEPVLWEGQVYIPTDLAGRVFAARTTPLQGRVDLTAWAALAHK